MTALWVPATGQLPTAGQFATYGPLAVHRLSDSTPIVSNTTLANDDTLLVTPSVSATYEIDMGIMYRSSATADLKVAMTWPTGATCWWGGIGLSPADVFAMQLIENGASGAALTFGGGGVGGTRAVWLSGLLVMSTTAGNLQVQFAQNTSDASNTVIRAGSWLTLRQTA